MVTLNRLTADEFFRAYERAIGVPHQGEEQSGMEKEIQSLADYLTRCMDEKVLTATRITELVDEVRQYDAAPELFEGYVDNARLSESEKKLCHDLVNTNAAGTLTVSDKRSGDELADVQFGDLQGARGRETAIRANTLVTLFKELRGRELEFSFESDA